MLLEASISIINKVKDSLARTRLQAIVLVNEKMTQLKSPFRMLKTKNQNKSKFSRLLALICIVASQKTNLLMKRKARRRKNK